MIDAFLLSNISTQHNSHNTSPSNTTKTKTTHRFYTLFIILSLHIIATHIPVCQCCVQLLNGWEPMSITQRAELADIVGVADILRTFKGEGELEEDGTYYAEIKLLSVHKGHDQMSGVDTLEGVPSNVFNVSNFGSTIHCYADVTQGLRYLLFLTVFERRLSAQYEDLFGAAETFSDNVEAEMLEYLGWDLWSEWSPCNTPCGGGKQFRSRECPRTKNGSACVGVGREFRSCNIFNCRDSLDLMTLMQQSEMATKGVTSHPNRSSTYVITKDAKLSLPVSNVLPTPFPNDFSILVRVKAARRQRGYFFVISNVRGTQEIGIFLGRKLKIHYLGNIYGFRADFLDSQWHSLGVIVQGRQMVLYVDCDVIMKRRLRMRGSELGDDLLMSVGPYFQKFGRPFEGEVEQLVLSSNPQVGASQCGPTVLTQTVPTIEILTSSTPNSVAPNHNSTSAMITLPDDACNPQCENNGICLDGNACRCQPNFSGSRCQIAGCSIPCQNGGLCQNGVCVCGANFTGDRCEIGLCNPHCENGGICASHGKCQCVEEFYGERCQHYCPSPCLNGGTCRGNGSCECRNGYTGRNCEKFVCPQGCLNGGMCVAPNLCKCPAGFHGPQCLPVKCKPRCRNGGLCMPSNVCLCKAGYTGRRCQRSICGKGCKNGGTCNTSTGKCDCLPLFFGGRCQRAKCRHDCLHGGRCRKNKCVCPQGFSGKRCERSTCKNEHYLIPYRKTYRKLIREKIPIPCGEWTTQTKCTKTRLKFIRITTRTYRGSYRCVL